MLNENNCLTCAEYKAKPSVGLQEVCHKLDTVIKLLENLQVNLEKKTLQARLKNLIP